MLKIFNIGIVYRVFPINAQVSYNVAHVDKVIQKPNAEL